MGLKVQLVNSLYIPGGPLKYNSVHMRDQNFFSKTPLNEFLLPDENHPQYEFTYRKKVTLNKFLLKKYTFHKFLLKI